MELEEKLKQLIIDTLNLEGMTPDDIPTDAALFSPDGVGLVVLSQSPFIGINIGIEERT